jgi:hypothetical protein
MMLKGACEKSRVVNRQPNPLVGLSRVECCSGHFVNYLTERVPEIGFEATGNEAAADWIRREVCSSCSARSKRRRTPPRESRQAVPALPFRAAVGEG